MELVFQNQTSAFLQVLLHERCAQEQTAELIVPDSFPDAARIVSTCAEVILRSKECRQGSLSVNGAIRAAVLYMPEQEQTPRTLSAYLPFSMRVDHPAATQQMQSCLTLHVRSADARMIHSRKVLLRVNLGCEVMGFAAADESFYSLQQQPDELQVKKQTYPLLLPVETAERSFSMQEELGTAEAKETPGSICWYTTQPLITERRLIGNKAVFKGLLILKTLYQTADGTLQTSRHELPFSQYCELTGDYEQELPLLLPLVTGAELELLPDSPEKPFRLSVNLLVQALVYDTISVELCEDAYSTRGVLQPQWKQYALPARLDRQQRHETLRGSLPVRAASVVDSTLYLDEPVQSRTPDGVEIRLPCTLSLLYFDEAGALQGTSGQLQLQTALPLAPNATCTVQASCGRDGFASAAADGTEIRYDVLLELESCAEQQLRGLSGGSIEPEQKPSGRRASIIIRRAGHMQSVWELAKQYATTEQAIRQVNALGEEQPEEDALLLIPVAL